jgi:predicted DNA-binding antitoxin AbrB/MazE fold protein
MNKLCKFLVVLLFGLWPCSAFAAGDDVVERVRELAKEAQADTNSGRYDAAAHKFMEAYQLAKVPTLARSIARALAKQGKLVAACEYYEQAISLTQNELWREQLQQKAQQEAAAERSELLPRLAHLRIHVEGAPAQQTRLSVDNVAVPQAVAGTEQLVDPGKRRVVAKHGDQVVEQNVELKEGEHREVVLRLAATSLPPPVEFTSESKSTNKKSIQPVLGWVGVGIGVAGVAVGTTAGIIAEVKRSSLHSDGCRDRWCPTSFSGRVDSYNQLLTVSTVGFVVGAVGAAAGITLLLTSPHHDSKAPVGLWVGPSSVALQGGF